MTIREKVQSLGLNSKQTIEVTLLLTAAFVHGSVWCEVLTGSDINRDLVADEAVKILDGEYLNPPMPPNNAVFSNVFGIDLTNELP